MSMWQATELHLIAMGVWGGQIHWSVSSVVDMYNMFLLMAFAESRAWRAHKSPRPVKCQTSSSDSSAALSNPYVNIHREWKCNDYIRPCWGWGKLLLITEISQIAIELIIQHVYLISYFNPVPGSGLTINSPMMRKRARPIWSQDVAKKQVIINICLLHNDTMVCFVLDIKLSIKCNSYWESFEFTSSMKKTELIQFAI